MNLLLVFVSLNNFVMSLHLLSITEKQKKFLNYLGKKICCWKRAKDKKLNSNREEAYLDPLTSEERLNKLIEEESQSICHEIAHRIMHPSKNYLGVVGITFMF